MHRWICNNSFVVENTRGCLTFSSADARYSTQSAVLSQPACKGMHTVCVDLNEANKFSEHEQWAVLYNDEELRLALEETMSPM